ncbi:MAG: glycoside hydrolase family 36 protein [Acidimicrobiales bacterium]
MQIETADGRLTMTADDGRCGIGPSTARVRYSLDGDTRERRAGDVDGEGSVRLEFEVTAVGDDAEVRARVVNGGIRPVTLDRLWLVSAGTVRVGDDPRRWRMYRNGYQSWAGTWTIGTDERDRDVPTRFGRAGVTDARHAAASGKGHVRSDSVGAIVDATTGDALAVGVTTLADAFGFVEVDAPDGTVRSFEVWFDLDDTELAAGASTPWFAARVATGDGAFQRVIDAAGDAMSALGRDRPHPSGWCSWYYYFTKVTEADVMANLDVLAADGVRGPTFGCEYVMVDDGHQQAIGDWLTTNEKFPSGMAAVAKRITDAGFDAGIWWAPFIVSATSEVARRHPEWLVRNERGRPILGLLNPGWGITNPMRVLDTTRPDVLEHLRSIAATIANEWGYRIQKIDFLYAASLPGVRHDPTATRAQALRRGIEAVRAGAGDDGFVLGCGCPLGPAVGLVDALRIGADVTPRWSNALARTVGRDRHALATSNALLNTLTRVPFDRSWFLNDPDCLMVRDSDTKLTLEEVRLMCTIFGMTDGMVVLSDRMDRVSPERAAMVGRTHALAGGDAEVADLFEHALPEVLVSRHADRVDVAALNLSDRPRRALLDLARRGVPVPDGDVTEFWTGTAVRRSGSLLDLGELAPHSARVVQVPITTQGDHRG